MRFDEFGSLIKESASLISVLTFLLGILIGNRQAIGRDKRKEFNDLTDKLFSELTRCVNSESIFSADIDVARIAPHLSIFSRSSFAKIVKRQRELINQVGSYNFQTSEVVVDKVKLKALNQYQKKILGYVNRR